MQRIQSMFHELRHGRRIRCQSLALLRWMVLAFFRWCSSSLLQAVTNAELAQGFVRRKSLDVYVSNHQSHLDYMGIVSDLHPQHRHIKVASGENLRFGLIGFLIQHSFAFFVSRSYRQQSVVYKKAFLRYLEHLVVTRNPLLLFMEGGRSRTGRLRPAQTGLIYMILHEAMRNHFSEVVFHPITVSYDVVPEGRSLLAEKAKTPESTWRSIRGFLSFLSGPRLSSYRYYGEAIKVTIDREFHLEKATLKLSDELRSAILSNGYFNFGGFLYQLLESGTVPLSECYNQWLELHPFFMNQKHFADSGHLRDFLEARFGQPGLISLEGDGMLSLSERGREALQYSGAYFAETVAFIRSSRQQEKQRVVLC